MYVICQTPKGETIKQIQTFVSTQVGITFGVPIIFNHGFSDFNPLVNFFSFEPCLVNTVADHGYFPGQIITPYQGIAFEINSTQLIAHVEDGGVFLIRKDNGKDTKIDTASWNLMVKAIAL